MKALAISLALLASVRMHVCSSDDEASPPPLPAANTKPPTTAAPEPSPAPMPTPSAPAALPAQHGGTVVATGEFSVEVVPHSSGHVYAYFLGPVAPAADVEVRVELPVARKPPQTVILRWDGQRRHYAGHAPNVVFVPGPLVVHVVAGARVWVGHAATILILPAAVLQVHHHKHKRHEKHKRHKHH